MYVDNLTANRIWENQMGFSIALGIALGAGIGARGEAIR
jgi:hypothetical protein